MSGDNDYAAVTPCVLTGEMKPADMVSGDLYADRDYGEVWGMLLPVDPTRALVETRTELMGTQSVERRYRIHTDGRFAPRRDYFTYSFEYSFTAKADVPAAAVDKDGNEGGAVTVRSGEKLTAYRTDMETYVDAKREDGSICRFAVRHDDENWQDLVDGKPVMDLFDGIIYAG